MTTSFKNWLLGILVLIFLVGIFFAGYYTYKSSHPCLVSYDTTYVRDTVTHTIQVKVPYYVQKLDTIIVTDSIEIPAEVDTAAILTAFYSTYQYTRTFEDTLLKAVLEDRVTQNKPAVVSFDYTIKRPQTVIQNINKSVYYNKYLYVGGSIPLYDAKMAGLGGFVAFPRGMAGIEYIPYNKSVSLTGAFTLFKFK